MDGRPLAKKVCLVTGASRGIGKGIALQLGEKGAKVYITGRTLNSCKDTGNFGSLRDTAAEIEARGGKCVPVQCDHTNDEDIKRLFEQINDENEGQLDILVNNAFGAADFAFDNFGLKFWEMPVSMWDEVNGAGLRNNYFCTVYAARMMTKRKQGLIINISSSGGLNSNFSFNVSYGVGKEACDRMAADCAHELYSSNVAFVSIWPGQVKTEFVTNLLKETNVDVDTEVGRRRQKGKQLLSNLVNRESPEYVGRCIVALATDRNIMKKSGKILLTYDLGQVYGLKDKDGHRPDDLCNVKEILKWNGFTYIAALTPSFLRIPKWMLALFGNKFY